MNTSKFNDIIVGISTGFSDGAISIIRLSGEKSIDLVNSIFKGKDLTKQKSHTIHYGYIYDSENIIDEVLVSIFKAPKTYTTEDVVEINAHGGMFVTNKIYELCVLKGARPAEPGEFTKRAYLNGRIDLTKAESVMDMIEAESNSAVKLASRGLQGFIKDKVDSFREKLLDIIANISVSIDYPEYDDIEELTNEKIKPNIIYIKDEIENLINGSKGAKYLKNGIDTAIIGKPNVGKSSLLNAIIEENKAIVTNIPGTTRDIVEAKINLKNITLNLIDTAGIRNASDEVEKIGVEKSIESIEKADLILYVLDGTEDLNEIDSELYKKIKEKLHIIIFTKKDIRTSQSSFKDNNELYISTFDKTDINLLKEKILEITEVNKLENKDVTYISNARQLEKLKKAYDSINESLAEINDGAFLDFIEIQLRAAWLYLGEITGESSTDDLINELFSKFCLGK